MQRLIKHVWMNHGGEAVSVGCEGGVRGAGVHQGLQGGSQGAQTSRRTQPTTSAQPTFAMSAHHAHAKRTAHFGVFGRTQ